MSSQKGIAKCPRCDRMIATDGSRYKQHSLVEGGECPMTEQHTPITGFTNQDFLSRGYVVADLAQQVQDRDTRIVWDVLTALPAAEVQRLLMIALAAVPTDKPLTEIFGWVCDLPSAKETA
jgi:hypothetical protein